MKGSNDPFIDIVGLATKALQSSLKYCQGPNSPSKKTLNELGWVGLSIEMQNKL